MSVLVPRFLNRWIDRCAQQVSHPRVSCERLEPVHNRVPEVELPKPGPRKSPSKLAREELVAEEVKKELRSAASRALAVALLQQVVLEVPAWPRARWAV